MKKSEKVWAVLLAVPFLPAENCFSVKADATPCSKLGQISLGAHTIQMLSNYIWVEHFI